MKKTEFVHVKKIISIINSCNTIKQLKSCDNLVRNYINYAERKGVVNCDELENRLNEEIKKQKILINS